MKRGVPTILSILAVVAALSIWAWASIADKGQEQAPATTLAAAETAPVANSLRVMTANIRLAEPDDGINAWPNRREFLVKTLLKHGPDLIATQEVTPAQGAYLVKELGKWYDHFPRAGVGNVDETGGGTTGGKILGAMSEALASMNTLFVKSDRFDIVDGEAGLVLPGELQTVATENTFYTLAVLQDKSPTGVGKLIVVDTHLRHGEAFAARCAAKIREHIAAAQKKYPDARVIVMGDMNHPQGSKTYAALIGAPASPDNLGQLTDSFDYAKRNPRELWGNWHAFTGKPVAALPSDLILTSPTFKPKNTEILRDTDDKGHYPSDHFFVMTDLQAK